MLLPFRSPVPFLVLALAPSMATASSRMVARFDAAVASLSPAEGASSGLVRRTTRSAADFTVDRRFNVQLDFPGDMPGTMYGGMLHGEAAVFTRVGDYLDATVLRNGDTEVESFDDPVGGATPADPAVVGTGTSSWRSRRSVGPGHFEDPAAYTLHLHFMQHDDLYDHSSRDLHARYVAWWLADMANRALPAEPLRVSYTERVPLLTSVAYGDKGSLDVFERTLKALEHTYGTHVDRTYKHKYVLLTARPPMPGTAGVAFEGGNEAIASIAGRARIVAHEVGHMMGATHANAETRGWWGCETNMLAIASRWRSDCLEYTDANRRAIRSYMRHGPDTVMPRKMVDGPAAE